jgi:hypothetical protein
MVHSRPEPGCAEIEFAAAQAVGEPAEVALEDYARAVARARAAEAVRDGAGAVGAVHLCGLEAPPSSDARRDVEDFARALAAGTAGGGLGWS